MKHYISFHSCVWTIEMWIVMMLLLVPCRWYADLLFYSARYFKSVVMNLALLLYKLTVPQKWLLVIILIILVCSHVLFFRKKVQTLSVLDQEHYHWATQPTILCCHLPELSQTVFTSLVSLYWSWGTRDDLNKDKVLEAQQK